jgi:hypothetical protein
MKRVQSTAGAFHAFQCLRDSADGLDRRTVHSVGSYALLRFDLSHGAGIPVQSKMHRLCIEMAISGRFSTSILTWLEGQ